MLTITDKLRVGVPKIDQQHQVLFDRIDLFGNLSLVNLGELALTYIGFLCYVAALLPQQGAQNGTLATCTDQKR